MLKMKNKYKKISVIVVGILVIAMICSTMIIGNAANNSNYVPLFWGNQSASNWDQAVSVDTKKNGGSFDTSNIKPGGHFYVEYSGSNKKVEFILQSWSGGSEWAKVNMSESGKANGHYFAKYSYENCVSALGTNNFVNKLDKIHVGAAGSKITVYSVCYDFGSGTVDNGDVTPTKSPSNGKEIVVKNGGTSLSSAVKQASSGTTIVIDGTIYSGSVSLPSGVHISGKNNATIDFSKTSGSSGRGITIANSGSTIENITVKNAADNGFYITGSNNTFKNVTCCYNKDSGFQVSEGGAYNKFYNCKSHHNADTKGENADGFAVKLHSGEGNYFEGCIAENNSDDGWDCYAAHGAVTFKNCQANYNGNCNGIKGDGNGFKLGGVDNKTKGVAAHLDPLNHTLINCVAKGNEKNGFDRNNQNGVVTMKNCTGDSNKGKNFNWPLTGKPSALGYEVTFGKAIIQDCTSRNGSNNIKGATLQGNCKGF